MYVVSSRPFGSPLPKELAKLEAGKRHVSAQWLKSWENTLGAPVWQLDRATLVCLQLAEQCLDRKVASQNAISELGLEVVWPIKPHVSSLLSKAQRCGSSMDKLWRVLTLRGLVKEAVPMQKFVAGFQQLFGQPYGFEAFMQVNKRKLQASSLQD